MEDQLDLIVKDIISKKELSNLDPTFVRQKVELHIKNIPKAREKLDEFGFEKFKRSRQYDLLKQGVRSELRKLYGVFIGKDYDKRFKILETEDFDKLLELHQSSKERLGYHEEIYKKIFEITKKPTSILDLACGLNPLSYQYLGCTPKYLACDISAKDLEFVQKFFDQQKIDGKTQKLNLLTDDVSQISKDYDISFLFKTLDSLETIKRNSSRELLSKINSSNIVVSFATKTIGGRKSINTKKRSWVARVANGLGMAVMSFEVPGEIFYVLTRDKKD